MFHIDNGGLVSDAEAIRMTMAVVGRGDGLYQVRDECAVKVSGDTYRIVSRPGYFEHLLKFVSTVQIDGFVSNAELYELYVADGGELPKAMFFRRLSPWMKKYRPEVKRTHSGSVRGYGTL